METQQSKIEFRYVNEFGDEVVTKETFESNVLEVMDKNTFEYIVERFKAFLIFAQFNEDTVNQIRYMDDGLELKK